MNGLEMKNEPHSGVLADSTSRIILGKANNSENVINGIIDEVRIYDQAISEHDLQIGFEIWHAPIHARIAQYLYVQVPHYDRNNNHLLRIVVDGTQSGEKIIFEETGLNAEEKVLFKPGELSADDYVLVAKLLDGAKQEVDEYQIRFNKDYNGVPTVGIKENNAICYDGEPIFPVTSYILNPAHIEEWKENDYVNMLVGTGCYITPSLDTGKNYLGRAHDAVFNREQEPLK
jgi:hypothetical protein